MAKEKAPAFQWYPKDCDTDENVRMMTDEELGFYMRCLNHQWINGSIPKDCDSLAKVLGKSRRVVRRLAQRVGCCFTESETPGRLVNERLERQRNQQLEYSENQSKAGRIGAEKRWVRHGDPMDDSIATPMAELWPPIPSATPNGVPTSVQGVFISREKTHAPVVSSPPAAYDNSTGWEKFAAEYPNIRSLDAAAMAWASVVISAEIEAEVLAGLERWKLSAEWNRGIHADATTFLLGNGTTMALFRGRPAPYVSRAERERQENYRDLGLT